MTIDLNCDMGELPEIPEAAIMPLIDSANVACGGHAGDDSTMARTVALARAHGVAVGAHPGYPDRANFGRLALSMTADEIADTVYRQILALQQHCEDIRHVKPHGALYNVAAQDPAVAAAIAEGVRRWRSGVTLVGLAGSRCLEVWRDAGFTVAAEGFADRAYEPDGSLRSRALPGALIVDPAAAAAQAIRLAREGRVQTLCVHSDTAGAVDILRAVRAALWQT